MKQIEMLPRNVYFSKNFDGNIEREWVTNTELDKIKEVCKRKKINFEEQHVKENTIAI